MTFICIDLVPNIISWSSTFALRALSRASPIFDQEIYRQGIRIIYYGKKAKRLCSGRPEVIRTSNNWLFVLRDNRFIHLDRTLILNKSYSCFVRAKIYETSVVGSSGTFIIDLFGMRVINIISRVEYALTRVKKIIVAENESIEIEHLDGNYVVIDKNKILNSVVFNTLIHGFKYIDSDTGYVLDTDVRAFYCAKIKVIFRNKEWIRGVEN